MFTFYKPLKFQDNWQESSENSVSRLFENFLDLPSIEIFNTSALKYSILLKTYEILPNVTI